MDELSEKLAGILNDPESMQRVRQMAQSLLGSEKTEQEPPNTENPLSLLTGEGMPDAKQLKTIMGIMSKLNSTAGDNRAELLLALKPHLSEQRRSKVDSAVKILKLIELLPLLKDSGLIDF